MKNNTLKWLSQSAGRKKLRIILLSVIQAALGGSGVLYALLLRNTVDGAADKDKKAFLISIISVAILVVIQILLRASVRRLEELSRSDLENTFKARLFGVLLRKNYSSVTEKHSGEWLTRLTSDTQNVANGMTEILPGILGMAVKMLGALIILMVIEHRLMYILIPCGLVLILFTYIFRKKLKSLHKDIQHKDGLLRIFMQERLGSLAIIRCFSAEKSTEHLAAEKMAEHKKARMKRNSFSNICNMGFAAAMNGMYILGLFYCGFGIIGGRISFGTLAAVLQLISQIQTPFANITGYLPKYYAMTASAERLREAEFFENNSTVPPASLSDVQYYYSSVFSEISIRDIDFNYSKGQQVLSKFSMTIKKDENIAFTGQSGCGKSTLMKLLLRLYCEDSGEIFLVDKNGKAKPLASNMHRLFAYVPQGNYLMSGSIRDIVSLGNPECRDDVKIKKALHIACADEFTDKLDNGLDTVIGENGLGLSEGQLQRISVARAIFSDNPILLLDEATSALDEQTERRLLENIRSMTDKTVLIITHRPAALEICDKIITMKGKCRYEASSI